MFTARQQELRERNVDRNGVSLNGAFDLLTVGDLQDWNADYFATGTIRILDGDWQGSATISPNTTGHSEQTNSPRLFEMESKVKYTRGY